MERKCGFWSKNEGEKDFNQEIYSIYDISIKQNTLMAHKWEQKRSKTMAILSRVTLYLQKRGEDGLRWAAIQWKVIIEYYSPIFSPALSIFCEGFH